MQTIYAEFKNKYSFPNLMENKLPSSKYQKASSKYQKVKSAVIDAKDYVKCTLHNGYTSVGYGLAGYVAGRIIYGDGSDYDLLTGIGIVAAVILLYTQGGYHTYSSYKKTQNIIEQGKINHEIANPEDKEICDMIGINLAIKEAGGLDACFEKKELMNNKGAKRRQVYSLDDEMSW